MLLFAGGVVLVAAAALRSRPRRTGLVFLWLAGWSTAAGLELIRGTGWWEWLLVPFLLVIAFIGLVTLVS